jgi:hypothetical protein
VTSPEWRTPHPRRHKEWPGSLLWAGIRHQGLGHPRCLGEISGLLKVLAFLPPLALFCICLKHTCPFWSPVSLEPCPRKLHLDQPPSGGSKRGSNPTLHLETAPQGHRISAREQGRSGLWGQSSFLLKWGGVSQRGERDKKRASRLTLVFPL